MILSHPLWKAWQKNYITAVSKGVNLTYTSDIKEALTGASYIVSSGGAARKAGMTREDLLKGNAEIAAQFGKDVRQYCPNVKHIVVILTLLISQD